MAYDQEETDMKTLYLHIGTPKTATTSIQTFCSDNREILERHGYCYPLFEYKFAKASQYRNAHFLIGVIEDEEGNRQYEREQEIVNEGIGRILELFKTYDNVILSDEGIWNRGFFEDTHCWERLKKGFKEKEIAVKVIVYLRRQDDFLFSWWNQQVKAGMVGSSVFSWDEIVEERPYIQLDYYDMLTKISTYVGVQNITVRIFDKGHFAGGSIYTDFMEAVHLELTDDYRINSPMNNPSLTKNNIEIKRILNMMPDLNKQKNDYFRKVVTQLSEENPEEGRSSMFSEEENKRFLEQFREGNAKIVKEYLGKDGDLFDDAYLADGKWQINNEQMIRDMIRFFGTAVSYIMEENRVLKERDKALKEQLDAQKQHINNIRYKMRHPVKAVSEKLKRTGKE